MTSTGIGAKKMNESRKKELYDKFEGSYDYLFDDYIKQIECKEKELKHAKINMVILFLMGCFLGYLLSTIMMGG